LVYLTRQGTDATVAAKGAVIKAEARTDSAQQ
jgi:hypothetical protein